MLWVVPAIVVLLAGMWVYDRRVRARRGRLGDVGRTERRAVREVYGNPEAHRAAMQPQRFDQMGGF